MCSHERLEELQVLSPVQCNFNFDYELLHGSKLFELICFFYESTIVNHFLTWNPNRFNCFGDEIYEFVPNL